MNEVMIINQFTTTFINMRKTFISCSQRSIWFLRDIIINNYITKHPAFRKNYFLRNAAAVLENFDLYHNVFAEEEVITKSYFKNIRFEIRKLFISVFLEDLLSYLFNVYQNFILYVDKQSPFIRPLYHDYNFEFSAFNPNAKIAIKTKYGQPDLCLLRLELSWSMDDFCVWNNGIVMIDIFDPSFKNLQLRLIDSRYSDIDLNTELSTKSYEMNLNEFIYFSELNIVKFFEYRGGRIILE